MILVFANPYPKAHKEESPMESNPKGPPRRSRNKSLDLCLGWEKKCKGKWSTIEYRSAAIQVFCRIQVFYIIHIFCRMTLADEDKLSLIPFWSNKHYMAHKGPNPLSNRKNCLDTRKWGLFRSCYKCPSETYWWSRWNFSFWI